MNPPGLVRVPYGSAAEFVGDCSPVAYTRALLYATMVDAVSAHRVERDHVPVASSHMTESHALSQLVSAGTLVPRHWYVGPTPAWRGVTQASVLHALRLSSKRVPVATMLGMPNAAGLFIARKSVRKRKTAVATPVTGNVV